MILFAFEPYHSMVEVLHKATDLTLGSFGVMRLENGELHIDLRTAVASGRCVVLGSIAPPDEQLLSAFLLAHTLKKEGALGDGGFPLPGLCQA
jgi:phosphoribosylpyrophosphate synthetase